VTLHAKGWLADASLASLLGTNVNFAVNVIEA
jgi:hypothetical protein